MWFFLIPQSITKSWIKIFLLRRLSRLFDVISKQCWIVSVGGFLGVPEKGIKAMFAFVADVMFACPDVYILQGWF